MATRPSMRSAINAFCRSCIHDPREKGSWREQVQACLCEGCPLWRVRPQPRPRQNGVETTPGRPQIQPPVDDRG